jgi:hypothetical protein
MKAIHLSLVVLLLFAGLVLAVSACDFKLDDWTIQIAGQSCPGGPLMTIPAYAPEFYIGAYPIYIFSAFFSTSNENIPDVYLYKSPQGNIFNEQLKDTGPELAKATIQIQSSNIVNENGRDFYIAKGPLKLDIGYGTDIYTVITVLDGNTAIGFVSPYENAVKNAALRFTATKQGLSLTGNKPQQQDTNEAQQALENWAKKNNGGLPPLAHFDF